MEGLIQDLRYALRGLRRDPGFAAVAVGTLALGIGATTAIFTVVNAILLRPLPYAEPDRIMQVWQVGERGNQGIWSDQNLEDVRSQNRSFVALAEYGNVTATVAGPAEPERVPAALVGSDFLTVMGVRPILGRGPLPEEARQGAPVVLVAHAYWQRSLAGDPAVLGRTLRIERIPHTIVGVMPPGFDFPNDARLWAPRQPRPQATRTGHAWRVVGRLRDGVTVEQARQDLSAIAARLKQQHGDDTWMADAAVVPLRDEMVGRVRPALLLMMGAAALLLLIACANVSNLLLARTTARQREVVVRRALGAGRGRLARQFLIETLVLSTAGGILGLLLARWGVDALLALEPAGLPRVEEVGLDWTVLGFTLAISGLAAAVLALITAVWAAAVDVRGALAETQRTHAPGQGGAGGGRSALAVGQVALTLVLLVGATLLGRSLLRILDVDAGYRTEGAVVVELPLGYGETDADRARTARLHDELLARLRSLPRVQSAGGVNAFPLSGGGADGQFLIVSSAEGVTDFEQWGEWSRDESRVGYAEYRIASEGYFRAMGIPLLRGRLFDERDRGDAPQAAVISESLARTRWPAEDPIGKRVQYANMDGDFRVLTIVGVVGDVRERSLEAEPRPTFYANARQRSASLGGSYSIVLQGPFDRGQIVAAARRIVRELDPTIPLRFRTLEEIFAASLADRRFSLILLGVFAGTALLLAAMGIYGVIAYLVARRTREIGIRMALGARESGVLRLVLRQGLAFAVVGILVGLAASAALTRLLASFLYDVSALDPLTFVSAALLLLGFALTATYVPARRAARVDPARVLKAE